MIKIDFTGKTALSTGGTKGIGLAANQVDLSPIREMFEAAVGSGLKRPAYRALGLKIRNGCSYHGLSLNVDMDLSPFTAINPCGYAGLKVTQTRDLGIPLTAHEAGEQLSHHLLRQLDQQHG